MTDITHYTGSRNVFSWREVEKSPPPKKKWKKEILELHHSTFGKQGKYLGIINLGLYYNDLEYFVLYRDSSTVMSA